MATKPKPPTDEQQLQAAGVPTLDEAKATFGLFVSAVEGHHVSRYGSGHGRTDKVIGCVGRNPDDKLGLPIATFAGADKDGGSLAGRGAGRRLMNHELIVGLTHEELQRYPREYARALRDGALRERSAEEYHAQLRSALIAELAAREAADKASAKDATADKTATTSAPPTGSADPVGAP